MSCQEYQLILSAFLTPTGGKMSTQKKRTKSQNRYPIDLKHKIVKNGKHGYLISITDAYSRKVLGYNVDISMNTEFCMVALTNAVNQWIFPKRNLMHRSDKGVQYYSSNSQFGYSSLI